MSRYNITTSMNTFGRNKTKTNLEMQNLALVQQLSLAIIEKILPLMFALGLCCNILIIVYFIKINVRKTKRLKKMSVYHYLIINLAFSDLLTCIGAPFTINANF